MPALLFDCDGVLADTEQHGHRVAFNTVFAELGLPVNWSSDEYGKLLSIGGGKERMATLFTEPHAAALGLPSDSSEQRELLAAWHARKTEIYTELVAAGSIPIRPGVTRLLNEAIAADWRVAVASTSAVPSVAAVLRRAVDEDTAQRIHIFAGDMVPAKKPAPDIYLLALNELGVRAKNALVIEDSGIGLTAAADAGIATVVTVSAYTSDDDFSQAALVLSSLGDPADAHGENGVAADVLAAPYGIQPTGPFRLSDAANLIFLER